jgi:hypothetical protein
MSMAKYSAVTAAALFADHLWTKPVLSSESLDWPNVIARRYLNCLPACVVIPPLRDDIVIITIAGTTRIDGSMLRQFSGEVGAPGSLFLTPRGTPAMWIHSHTVDIFHLYLQPEFLPSIAVEAGCSSLEQTELCELLSHNDILLESLVNIHNKKAESPFVALVSEITLSSYESYFRH